MWAENPSFKRSSFGGQGTTIAHAPPHSKRVVLADSAGRGIADRMDRFEASFLAPPYMRHIPENTPIFMIRDGIAAPHGCRVALS